MTVFVATKNDGKFHELAAIFAVFGWELRRFAGYRDVAEGDTSYAENAALKARALWEQLRAAGKPSAVLGDDSGLEVAALGGRPGVLSARYGGSRATWAERRRMLLDELAETGGADRRARFVCALHLIDAAGRATDVRGTLDGLIATSERGAAGFSYDPVFEFPALNRTFGELSDREKNGVSHRAVAARKLVAALAGESAATPEISGRNGNNPAAGT